MTREFLERRCRMLFETGISILPQQLTLANLADMIPREILKNIPQIEIRTNRIVNVTRLVYLPAHSINPAAGFSKDAASPPWGEGRDEGGRKSNPL